MLTSMDDIRTKARYLVNDWFTLQCRNPLQVFCWWYRETTSDQDGDFVVATERPEIDYFYAGNLARHLTKDQNLMHFLEIARRLPILSLSNLDQEAIVMPNLRDVAIKVNATEDISLAAW